LKIKEVVQMKLLLPKFSWLTVVIISLFILNTSEAQQVNRIFEDIGGGSGNASNIAETEDNTIYYVLGAAVIAGVVIYAVLQDKKSKDKSKTDTTAVLLNEDFLEQQLTLSDKIQKYKSQFPINVSIGMQPSFIDKEEKRYFVGMSYNF